MAYREGPLQDWRVPLTWAGAAAAIVAIVIALALLFTARREAGSNDAYGAARSEFDQVAAPVSGAVAAPLRWAGQGTDFVRGYFFAVSENRRLRQQVRELEGWRDAAIALKNINTRYESLLKLRTEPPIPMVSARVVADARGPFSNARLADAGTDRGVTVGNPVLSEHGVLGRVVGVAPTASRILLLTDVDSHTPVLVDRTNARAILTGDGGGSPRLEFVRGRDPVKAGDRILTSGDGGLYPRGLPVGVAVSDRRGGWRVQLYTDQGDIDYVRILVFNDFSQMVDQAALASAPIPPLSAQERAEIQAAVAGKPLPPPPAPATAVTPPAPGALLQPPALSATAKPATPAAAATRPVPVQPPAARPLAASGASAALAASAAKHSAPTPANGAAGPRPSAGASTSTSTSRPATPPRPRPPRPATGAAAGEHTPPAAPPSAPPPSSPASGVQGLL